MLKNLLVFIICLCPTLALADGGRDLYSDKIYEIQSAGHINQDDAQKTIFSLSLKNEYDHQKIREQTRGVASAIRGEKVIKFTNKAIEIFVD